MAVKRKTEQDIEEALAGQIPDATTEAVNTETADKSAYEAELRKKIEAEVREQMSKENKQNTEQFDAAKVGLVGGTLMHSFGSVDEGFKDEINEMVDQKHLSKIGDSIRDNALVRDGWMYVDKELLGERAQYYPENWEFMVRPATVEAIRNWSTVDERNPFNVSDTLNEVLKYCLSIKTPQGSQPWSQINSWDKLFFVLLIREYTFREGENKIEITEDCVNCDSPVTFTFDSQSLMYELSDPEVMKYFDRNTRTWNIDPEEFDINEPPITLYNPTVDKEIVLQDWLIEKSQENNKYKPDASFMRFVTWLLPKFSKDSTIFKRQIKEAQLKFKSWDRDMFSFMDEVMRNINVRMLPTISTICPACGEEVTTTANFPDGIGSLFIAKREHRKFGSK